MGSRARTNQTPAPNESDVISSYDESFVTSNDGKPVQWGRGEFKSAGQYVICPFYGQHTVQEPSQGGGKK